MILPPPGDPFEWRETAAGPALVCRPLELVATHLFTSRTWALGRSRDGGADPWHEVAQAMDVADDRLVRLRQVHGATVVRAQPTVDRHTDARPVADIVLSDDPSMAIAVQAADCVPLLIADARLGVVAAAHAGWRGLALGVPRTTVIELGRAFGSRPDDLVAAIGPSVGACCYEVGPEVRDAFARNGFSVEAIDGWFASSPRQLAGNPPMPGLRTEPKPGHAFFDGWSCAVDQLRAAGLHASQVFTSRLCTASHAGVLCSYRREGAVAGRIAGVIRSRRRS